MKIAGVLASYSMAEADDLRKAMGKKIPAIMAKHTLRFIQGAKDNGIAYDKAKKIFELIEKLNKTKSNQPPIIVYTGKDLTKKENETLEKYAESIIIKGVKSEERLLDETALFMHRVIADMPKNSKL